MTADEPISMLNPSFVAQVHAKRREADATRRTLRNTRDAEASLLHAARLTARPSLKAIARAVAAKNGIAVYIMLGRSRSRHVAAARQEAMRESARLRPDMSPADIGRFFDRDRTTILHALGRV